MICKLAFLVAMASACLLLLAMPTLANTAVPSKSCGTGLKWSNSVNRAVEDQCCSVQEKTYCCWPRNGRRVDDPFNEGLIKCQKAGQACPPGYFGNQYKHGIVCSSYPEDFKG